MDISSCIPTAPITTPSRNTLPFIMENLMIPGPIERLINKRMRLKRIAISSLLMLGAENAAALEPQAIFAQVKDSIVVVRTTNFAGEPFSQGSGVLVGRNSVATNCHVVEDAMEIYVETTAGRVPGKRKNVDLEKDLCIIQADLGDAKPAILGQAESLSVGAVVYAIGAPRGLALTFSNGIVSQLRGEAPPLIQTTAPMSPGSSGGGLFNVDGLLVGITTFNIIDGQSLNFALPVEWISEVIKNNKATGDFSQSKRRQRFLEAVSARDYQKAAKIAERWADAYPDDAEAYYRLGLAFLKLTNYDRAIDSFREGLRLASGYGPLWLQLGNAYFLKHQYDFAVTAYQEATRANPGDSKAWKLLGEAYLAEERNEEAVAAFKRAVELNPSDSDGWNALGDAYGLYALRPTGSGSFDEAHFRIQETKSMKAYKVAYTLEPNNVDHVVDLGMAIANSGDCAEASRLLIRVKSLDPVRGLEFASWLSRKYGPCN